MDGMMRLFSKISIIFLKPSISVPYQVPCQSFEASAPQFKTLLRNLMMAKMGNKEPDSDDSWIIGLVSAQTRMCLNQTLVCVTLPELKMLRLLFSIITIIIIIIQWLLCSLVHNRKILLYIFWAKNHVIQFVFFNMIRKHARKESFLVCWNLLCSLR